MRLIFLISISFLVYTNAYTQNAFPGIQQIMNVDEWNNSGLNKLNAEQIKLINSAISRNQVIQTERKEAEIKNKELDKKPEKSHISNIFSNFGLSAAVKSDWKSAPALKAKVIAWVTANQFLLDNMQIWEGSESIPYELVDKYIEIQQRPLGDLVLIIEGYNTTIRVSRIR